MKTEEKTKQELIEETLKRITKMFGEGAVMRLGDRPNVDLDVIPSGSLLLDECLGVGGYPKGRIIEIYGPESSGKTTLALHAIAECQKLGGRAAFIDAEHAIDPVYARNLGVNIDELILSQPDNGEQALDILEMLASSGGISLVVVDSVAALVPQAELDGEMGDSAVGLQARLMSKAMRKITATLNKNECAVIFINQLRDKVGVLYGNPETTTGGKALKFYASVRIDIRRAEAIGSGAAITGNTVKVRIVKNKVAPPFKQCLLDIIYGKGICKNTELAELGVQFEILKKIGSWFEYEGNRLANGKEAFKNYLDLHPELAEELEKKIVERLNSQQEK